LIDEFDLNIIRGDGNGCETSEIGVFEVHLKRWKRGGEGDGKEERRKGEGG